MENRGCSGGPVGMRACLWWEVLVMLLGPGVASPHCTVHMEKVEARQVCWPWKEGPNLVLPGED